MTGSSTQSFTPSRSCAGMDITQEETPQGLFLLNAIHIFSLFTFAILVGAERRSMPHQDDLCSRIGVIKG